MLKSRPVRQRLITPEQVSEGKRLVSEAGMGRYNSVLVLEDVTDPFIISLPTATINIMVLRNDAIATFRIPGVAWQEGGKSDGTGPSVSPPREYKAHLVN
ncbi:hypothetical protein D9611_006696 [Ephemerocybe angulata]|uniref:Uncharacterized protein n=1 Tax=Ephemerocybe angulata TaxID=980116 RepID=A0A8H5C728_9AGAR|nr:hypothetical protein D9611_006696 [Tulosesus angulatus]